MLNAKITKKDIWKALDKLASMRHGFAAKYAVILAPSAVDEVLLGLHDMGGPIFDTLWSALHTPVLNIPAFTGASGMPIGLSLAAGRYHDRHLLKVGKVIGDILRANFEGQENL